MKPGLSRRGGNSVVGRWAERLASLPMTTISVLRVAGARHAAAAEAAVRHAAAVDASVHRGSP